MICMYVYFFYNLISSGNFNKVRFYMKKSIKIFKVMKSRTKLMKNIIKDYPEIKKYWNLNI